MSKRQHVESARHRMAIAETVSERVCNVGRSIGPFENRGDQQPVLRFVARALVEWVRCWIELQRSLLVVLMLFFLTARWLQQVPDWITVSSVVENHWPLRSFGVDSVPNVRFEAPSFDK